MTTELEQKQQAEQPALWDDGVLIVRPWAYTALAYGEHLHMPRRVLFLLFELAKRPGVVQKRETLARRAWGTHAGEIQVKSVDAAISRLRRELARAIPLRCYVHTHPGIGYRFDAEPVARCGTISNCS